MLKFFRQSKDSKNNDIITTFVTLDNYNKC